MFQQLLRRALARCGIGTVALGLALCGQPALAATFTPLNFVDLQANVNSCALGDTIILDAGTTYTGELVLPNKGAGTAYITIQSNELSQLPPAGQRVKRAYPNASDPNHAQHMPRLQAPNSASTSTRTIKTVAGAHHFKFIGVEIVGMANDGPHTNLIDLGVGGTAQDTVAEVPHHFIFDRCILRANSGNQALRRGISMQSGSTDVINCHLEGFKDTGSGDSQAIGSWNGPGPYNIINNFIEAASENIIFGGEPVTVPNQVPSDIVVRQNHFYKPLAWKPTNWNVKNHFELKSGDGVIIDSNIFENSWHKAGDQKGKSLSFKLSQYSANEAAWLVTQNVTVTNNIIRNVGVGVSFGGNSAFAGGGISGWPRNITLRNNLFHDITDGATWAGNLGYFTLVQSEPQNVTLDRNTAFAVNRIMDVGSGTGPTGTSTGWVWINNVNNGGPTYDFKGQSSGGTSEQAFIDWLPGLVYRKNVVMGAASGDFLPNYHGDWNPTSLGFPSTWSTVLANFANPGTDYAGWKVTGASYATAAVTASGTALNVPIGCDIDALMDATSGCISGVWSSPPVTVTLKNGLNGYTGSTCFQASGGSPTTWFGPSTYHRDSNRHSPTTQYIARTFFKFDVSSIPAGKTIDSATLKIRTENTPGSNVFLNAYRVAPVGGAFTVNYAAATRNSPLGNATTWTGGLNAAGNVTDSNNDFVDTPDDSELVAGPAVYNLNVTSSVQAWVNGTPNNGWILTPNPTTPNVVIYMGTPADLNGSTHYPELEITYH